MSDVILVAVNDSPAAFKAAEVAVEYARLLGARLCAVVVIETGELDRHLDGAEALGVRRELAAAAVLSHVGAMGSTAGIEITGRRRSGAIAPEILAEARAVDAALIVMARVDRPGHAIPYIGSQTLRVLEFASVPVLVVPTYHER